MDKVDLLAGASLSDDDIEALAEVLSRLGRIVKTQLKGSPLTMPQMGMLMAVHRTTAEGGGIHPGEIAECCCLSGPAVTAALDDLVEKGYCVRAHTESDRRKVLIQTTSHGDAVMREALAGIGQGLRCMLHDWDRPRIRQLVTVLYDLDAAADAYRAQPKP